MLQNPTILNVQLIVKKLNGGPLQFSTPSWWILLDMVFCTHADQERKSMDSYWNLIQRATIFMCLSSIQGAIHMKINIYLKQDWKNHNTWMARHLFQKAIVLPLRFEEKFSNFHLTDPASSKIIHPPNWYLRCPLPPSGTSRNRGGTKGTFFQKTCSLR